MTTHFNGYFHQEIACKAHAVYLARSTATLIALCGWADTGKTTLSHQVCAHLRSLGVACAAISTDAFMQDRAERNARGLSGYDPRSIDILALNALIGDFFEGKSLHYRTYDNRSGTRASSTTLIPACRTLVVEGIHAFHPAIVELMHLKIFISSDEMTLRHMRQRGNVQKRGMDNLSAIARIDAEWSDYRQHLQPLSARADLLVHVDSDFNYKWAL